MPEGTPNKSTSAIREAMLAVFDTGEDSGPVVTRIELVGIRPEPRIEE